MVLCVFFPQYMFWFQLLVILDICSHWIQMYSSLIHGEASHKVTDLSANPIMRLYYMRVRVELYEIKINYNIYTKCLILYFSSQPVLFTFCAANELFFASLYMLHFGSGYACKPQQ